MRKTAIALAVVGALTVAANAQANTEVVTPADIDALYGENASIPADGVVSIKVNTKSTGYSAATGDADPSSLFPVSLAA